MAQPPSFKIVPDQEEIGQMQRDLRFHSCMNRQPKTLTPGQIEQFNRDGFLKGMRIFDTGRPRPTAATSIPY